MKRRDEVPTVTPRYMAAWAKLFARSPEELEEQRRASSPAMTGTKQKPLKGPISAPESTQTTEALPVPHSPKRKPENG